MLSKPDAQVAYENGVAVGVMADGETAKAKLVVGDPSYFPDKVRKSSRVSLALSGASVCQRLQCDVLYLLHEVAHHLDLFRHVYSIEMCHTGQAFPSAS